MTYPRVAHRLERAEDIFLRRVHIVVDWRHRAACKRAQPHLFDEPAAGERAPDLKRRYTKADRYCQRCAVRSDCFAAAVRDADSGWRSGKLLANGELDDLDRRLELSRGGSRR